jgi:hypothetical protein
MNVDVVDIGKLMRVSRELLAVFGKLNTSEASLLALWTFKFYGLRDDGGASASASLANERVDDE